MHNIIWSVQTWWYANLVYPIWLLWSLDLRSLIKPMCTFMSRQIELFRKRFVTHIAQVRFFASVCSSMFNQIATWIEWLVTHITRVWFFTSVCASMNNQISITERFVTDIALVIIFLLHFFNKVTAGCFYL